MRIEVILAGAVALLVAAAIGPQASAEDAAAFYSGRQVTFVIPTTPGGGFDLYSRVLVEFMRKYIPGRPNIVMQNMPGAAGVRAANYMFALAPKDGSVLGMPLSNVPFSEVIDPDAVKYRSAAFSWIGTVTPETEVLAVWRSSGVASIEDSKTKELVIGGTAKLGMPTLNAGLVKALLGSKFKIIMGYPAGIEAILAMENGEVQGRFNEWSSWKSQRPKWIADGLLNYLVQIGPKEPELPQVPSFLDLVKTPAEQAMVRLLQSNQLVGRSIYAPPAIPADRLAALRDAFEKTMRDPDFLARMKSEGLESNPQPGPALQGEIERTMEGADAAAGDIKRLLDL
jgi:tripartite-type tricarboxylate transporter receptor subunit TctC